MSALLREIYTLPGTAIDVTSQDSLDNVKLGLTPLVGNGVANDSAALIELAGEILITNWYFPINSECRIQNVDVPAHVEAIYGDGTIKSITPETGFYLPCFGLKHMPDTSLLIDGIKFEFDPYYPAGGLDVWYGVITLNKQYVHNIEIRNVIFNGNLTSHQSGILLSGAIESTGIKNIHIHDNEFYDIGTAGIEITKRDITPAENLSVDEIHIYNNLFDSTNKPLTAKWRCAISWSMTRGNCTTHNNTFINQKWDVELAGTKDVKVHNNYSTGVQEFFISADTNGDAYSEEESIDYVYDNHFESIYGRVRIVDSAPKKIYHNYIKGGIYHYDGVGGEIYENTIVRTVDFIGHAGRPYAAYMCEQGSATENQITFRDNEIYDEGTVVPPIRLHIDAQADTIVENNNIYRTASSGDCITNPTDATLTDNSCELGYIGDTPTSRLGAGLLTVPPVEIQGTWDDAIRTTYLSSSTTGVNNLELTQDDLGKVIGVKDTFSANFKNSGGAEISSGIFPDLDKYTIEYKCYGLLEDLNPTTGAGLGTYTEKEQIRHLTHENGAADLLYIDTVVQSYTPTLPDSATELIFTETATIGHADTVDFVSQDFKYSYGITIH